MQNGNHDNLVFSLLTLQVVMATEKNLTAESMLRLKAPSYLRTYANFRELKLSKHKKRFRLWIGLSHCLLYNDSIF